MKKFSFGFSFPTAPGALTPEIRLGSSRLSAGETRIVLPGDDLDVPLVVDDLVVDVNGLLVTCDLSRESRVGLRIDLDCPGFDLRETLFASDLPSSGAFMMSGENIVSVPRPVVVEGFSLRVSLVATSPVPSGARGCSIPGGILSTWEANVPSRNKTSMFPVQDAIEPALWRLEIGIDDPDDLDRPLRAALRLYIDSARLEHLLGRDAAPEVRRQAIGWLQAESFTAIVVHVLSNEVLRDHVAGWLSSNPPIEKSLNRSSVGHFIVRVMRRATSSDLTDLYRRLESHPLETTKAIRSRIAGVTQRRTREEVQS